MTDPRHHPFLFQIANMNMFYYYAATFSIELVP